MRVGAFESSGFHVHATYFQKLHTTSKKILELFKVKTLLKDESFLRATQTSRFRTFGVNPENG